MSIHPLMEVGFEPEAQILAPKGMAISYVKRALKDAGVTFSVRRTQMSPTPSIASRGVVYSGDGAVEEFLLLRAK